MKQIISYLLLIAISCSNAFGAVDNKFLRYLPADSLVKQKIEKCKKSRIPFCKRTYQKSCEYIIDVLKGHEAEMKPANSGVGGYFGGVLELLTVAVNNAAMKDAVRALLKKESDEVKWKEFNAILAACQKIKAERQERLAKEKQEQEEKAKNQAAQF